MSTPDPALAVDVVSAPAKPASPPAKRKSGPSKAQAAREVVVRELAKALAETEPGPMQNIRRIVTLVGADAARALVQRTEELEAAGGMMLPDGSRRRTRGGVFFVLAHDAAADAERARRAARQAARHESDRALLAVVEELLRHESAPLPAREIVARLAARLPKPPEPSLLGNALAWEIQTGGEASRFVRVNGKGFALRSAVSAATAVVRAAPPSSKATTAPREKVSPASPTRPASPAEVPASSAPTAPPSRARSSSSSSPAQRRIVTTRKAEVVVEVRRPRRDGPT